MAHAFACADTLASCGGSSATDDRFGSSLASLRNEGFLDMGSLDASDASGEIVLEMDPINRNECMVQGAGIRVQGSGCRVQGAEFRVQGSGCRVQGACRVVASRF